MKRSRIPILVMFGFVAAIGIGALGFQYVPSRAEIAQDAPTTVAVSLGDVIQSVNAPGTLVTVRERHLGMSASGPLAEIDVQPGESVAAGQKLAALANVDELVLFVEDARAELAAARAALQELMDSAPLTTAQAQLELANAQDALQKALYRRSVMQKGNRASSAAINAAEANLLLAKIELEKAQAGYHNVEHKSNQNRQKAIALSRLAAAQQRYDSALRQLNWYEGEPTEIQQAQLDAEVAIAEANLTAAEMKWERVKDGLDRHALERAETRVKRAEAQLLKAEDELKGATLHAPFSGVVLDVKAQVGDVVTAHTGFITLADLSVLEAVVSVIEEDLPQVEVGQSVDLFFDARPDVQGKGIVERIVPQRLQGDRPLYGVYIAVDTLPADLLAGMTVDASIITSIREDALRLPKALVRARSDGTAEVELWVDGHVQKRTIRVGLRGDSYIEILSGLHAGDEVIAE